ncbi:hypothetical protein K438DRAFT_2057811 [Mycena galopus ATCC 62051]|nr:hypothetical protein K438DRAFT_2057811 [Mycena galopus ATCC 62051]
MAKRNGKKKNDDDGDDTRKKCGQPSDFKGQHFSFLTEKIPGYIAAAKRRGTMEAKMEGLEPDPTASPPVIVTAEDTFTALGLNLKDEEQDRKLKFKRIPRRLVFLLLDMKKTKVKWWFLRQCPAAMGIHGNPFFEYLACLRQDEGKGLPRHSTDFRFYMKHPDFRDAVQTRFIEKHGSEPRAKHIALRCEVAKEMWAAESEEVQMKLHKENNAEHKRDLEAYRESSEGEPNADPEIQEQCRTNFSLMVQPLLVGLQAYTGLTLNIIGGRINEETKEFETISANAGIIDGKDWARWDPEGYAATLKLFLKFMHAGYLEVNNLVVNSPAPASPPAARVIDPSAFVGMNLLCMAESNGDGDVDMPLPNTEMASTGVEAPPSALLPLRKEDEIDRVLASGAVLPAALSASATPAPSVPVPPAPSASASAPPTPSVPAPPAPSAPAPPAPSASEAALPAPSASPPLAPPTPSASASASPKPMWGLSYLGNNLRKELLAMEAGQWEEYLRRLRRMTRSMQERERNLVRNRALEISMDLFGVAVFFGTKRKSKGKDQRRKKKAKGDEEDWDDGDEDSVSESNSEGEGEEEGENTPMRTRGKGRAAGVTAGSSKMPNAARGEGRGNGERLDRDCGAVTKSHPTTNRPKVMGAWVKNARKSVPDIGSTEGMEAQWWAWWKALTWAGSYATTSRCSWMVVSGDADSLGSMETRDGDVKWMLTHMVGSAPAPSTNDVLELPPAPGTAPGMNEAPAVPARVPEPELAPAPAPAPLLIPPPVQTMRPLRLRVRPSPSPCLHLHSLLIPLLAAVLAEALDQRSMRKHQADRTRQGLVQGGRWKPMDTVYRYPEHNHDRAGVPGAGRAREPDQHKQCGWELGHLGRGQR